MDYRFLGASGFKVSALGFGAGTFGGKGALFNAWGTTDVAQARRLIDLCLEAGVNFFDTADVYSDGASETILGQALAGRRERVVLSIADRHGYAGFIAHQVYYSLIGRDYEWELMPLGLDQGIGAVVWSPLGWGRLTGRVRRDRPAPTRRLQETAQFAPPVDDARLHRVIDVMDEIATQTGKSIPQIALNWLLQRPTVSTILIGARNEEQLQDNLGAVGWSLDAEQIARLDAVSALVPPYPYYPYWNGQFAERTPPPI